MNFVTLITSYTISITKCSNWVQQVNFHFTVSVITFSLPRCAVLELHLTADRPKQDTLRSKHGRNLYPFNYGSVTFTKL